MAEPLTDSSFAVKALNCPRVLCPTLAQQLQSDRSAAISGHSAKNTSETAGAVAVEEFVVAQQEGVAVSTEDAVPLQWREQITLSKLYYLTQKKADESVLKNKQSRAKDAERKQASEADQRSSKIARLHLSQDLH